jgi:transposase
MDEITRVFIDTSKRVFQLHGVNAAEEVVLRRQLPRSRMVEFFSRLPSTEIGLEACGASHHWARVLSGLGHRVRLIAPQLVKPYVKRGKNDAADAAGGCEAMGRPTMRFVPVKTAEQQAALMLAGVRGSIVRERTQLTNMIRGYAAEFGVVAAKGLCKIEPLLARIAGDQTLPALARDLFAGLGAAYQEVQARFAVIDAKLLAWHRANPVSRALGEIPGVGPIGASLLVMKTPDPRAFSSGRQYAAWLGLTPKDHSTAGKARPGVITRAGDEALRSVLVVGATAVIRMAMLGKGKGASPWLIALLERKAPKLAAVALANKIARIAWTMMATGEAYDARRPTLGQGAIAKPA